MNYVIIGNSTAAIGGIEGIRKADKDGSITVIASEPHHTYSRPLISYFLLDKTDENRMKYRNDDFYRNNNVNLMAGVTAVKINTGEKTVVLDNGGKVPYDRLLAATGSSPFVPQIPGIEKVKNVFTFMSLDDAHNLKRTLKSDANALIIGAGLIGLKCAGINMTGKSEAAFDKAIPMNAVGFFGLHIITAGNYAGEVYCGNKKGYKKLFYSDGKLIGYILVGCIEKAGIYTSLIREKTPLSELDFGLICEKPGLMAFTREERNRKLSGEV